MRRRLPHAGSDHLEYLFGALYSLPSSHADFSTADSDEIHGYAAVKVWLNFNIHVCYLLRVKAVGAATHAAAPVADVRCRPAGYPARYEIASAVMRGIADRHGLTTLFKPALTSIKPRNADRKYGARLCDSFKS
jgi:hypothetical protein